MIDIVLNGGRRHFATPLTVKELLDGEGLTGKRVAVERNGEIVPKSLHASTPVESGDHFEIVVAVGGG